METVRTVRSTGSLAAAVAACLVLSVMGQEASGFATLDSPSSSPDVPASSPPVLDRLPEQRPVTPVVREYRVPGLSRQGLATLARGQQQRARTAYAALSEAAPVTGFAVTGVTWTGTAAEGLALAVRTRAHDAWSTWTPLVYDADHGPSDAETRDAKAGTDPFVIGDVDAVQIRVTSETGEAPGGLTMSVIDPGTSKEVTSSTASTRTAPPVASLSASAAVPGATATPAPTIHSRAEWGADERLRDCCVEYGEVHAGFVHHTVNANDYTRAEVPAILRGIYAYHTQSRGWRDIGYNFLVDKFGRIWEGRYGGTALPVVGAHTLDYNENSFAASAIGNFETVQPSAALLDAYARLYAWKLSLHGVRPATRQQVGGRVFDAISGHRDAAATACPGRYLYAKVPDLITQASAYQHGFGGRSLKRSFLHDARPDVLLVSAADGRVRTARGTAAPGFERALGAIDGFARRDQVTGVGDVTGDKLNDVMMRDTVTGRTAVYRGRGDGTLSPPVATTARWAGTDLFAGPGDLTGDGRADLVARDATSHDLLVYAGRDDATFRAARVAVPAMAGLDQLSAAGDFDRDGHRDLLARRSGGALVLLLGDGTGHFPSRARLAQDWTAYEQTMGGVDLTGDGRPDVVGRDSTTKRLRVFAGVEGTTLSPALTRTPATAQAWSLSGDLTGDRRPDLISITAEGGLVLRPARRQNWLAPARDRAQSWPGVDRVMVVGDWDGDGYVDAMARETSTGMIWLYPGRSTGGFGARTQGWTGWSGRSEITPVGDFDGDGRPDLMARGSDGRIWLYPGRGLAGFGAPVIMRSSLPTGSTIVPVGLWNDDGAPDILVQSSTGAMSLYPGNGPGGLDDPVAIGSGFSRYTTLLGAGDLTGDGRADLLARTTDGSVWLLPGRGPSLELSGGRLADPRYVAHGWGGYRLG